MSAMMRDAREGKTQKITDKSTTKPTKPKVIQQTKSYLTRTQVRSVGHDTYPSVRLGNFENWGHGDTVLFLDTGTGTRRSILIKKYGKLVILTKSNNKTQIRHDFVGDFAN